MCGHETGFACISAENIPPGHYNIKLGENYDVKQYITILGFELCMETVLSFKGKFK